MSFLKIGTGFALPDYFDFDKIEQYPVHKHVYGAVVPEFDSPYWLEYQQEIKQGSIAFLKNLHGDYYMLAAYVAGYVQSLIPKLGVVDLAYVGLIKTHGSVGAHTDEPTRQCCINIGLKNSSGAVTKTSKTNVRKLFKLDAESNTCEDFCAYLLDTSALHAVDAVNNDPRYLFTYPFTLPFDKVAGYATVY